MKKVIINEAQLRMIAEITSGEINDEAKNVNLKPSDPQKEAGNYKMGHVSIKGMKITIETPKGRKREYKTRNGRTGSITLQNHYGYFGGTCGNGKDGDAVDVFIGPYPNNFENVYVIDQNNYDGEFDESKVMIGFKSKKEAKKAYLSNYNSGWSGFRCITEVPIEIFKKWLYRKHKQRKPFSEYVTIIKNKIDENQVKEKNSVYANKSSLDFANRKVGLTYNDTNNDNTDNICYYDVIKTDKMEDVYSRDTFVVPLKCGIDSYNITDIRGEEVMHFFKGKKAAIKNKYDGKEYDLTMKESDFKRFMNKFVKKVSTVVKYYINENFKQNEMPGEIVIYPVPSSSNFNVEMANRLVGIKNGLCGLNVSVENNKLLLKDLRNIQIDNEFIELNKGFYSGKLSDSEMAAKSHSWYGASVFDNVKTEVNRLNTAKTVFAYVNKLNSEAEDLIACVEKMRYIEKNGLKNDTSLTPELLYEKYIKYVSLLKKRTKFTYNSIYGNDTAKKRIKVDLTPKYTIDEDLNEYMFIKMKMVNRRMKKVIPITVFEPYKFEIKNLANSVRMGLCGMYTSNDSTKEDKEILRKEVESIEENNKLFVIFDDNISGGATLSDVCAECFRIGIKNILPITFGKMAEKNRITYELNVPDYSNEIDGMKRGQYKMKRLNNY